MSKSSTMTSVDPHRAVIHLTWPQVGELIERIAQQADDDGAPQTLVAVLRGGAIPSVWLSHHLQVRDVRAVEVTHTADDSPYAAKTPEPVAVNPASLGDLVGRDVLIVDDVAGSGQTLATVVRLVAQAGAGRVRTAVCAVNSDNWAGPQLAGATITYIGQTINGWVIFPWEATDEP